MTGKPPPSIFRILSIMTIKGRGLINQGSGLTPITHTVTPTSPRNDLLAKPS